MKRIFLLTTFITLTLILPAQEDEVESEPNVKSKLSIGFLISPNVSSRTISTKKGDPYSTLIEFQNKNHGPKFGYTAGIILNYATKKKLSLQTGLQFSDKGYRLKKQGPLTYESQFNGSGFNPVLPGEPITHVSEIQYHYFVDVPLQVKYTFFKKKIDLYVVSGIDLNFNVANYYIFISWYEDGSKEKEKINYSNSFKRVNLSATVGFGIDIHVSGKTTFFIQPTYRHMLLAMVDASIKKRLYSGGIDTGFSFNL